MTITNTKQTAGTVDTLERGRTYEKQDGCFFLIRTGKNSCLWVRIVEPDVKTLPGFDNLWNVAKKIIGEGKWQLLVQLENSVFAVRYLAGVANYRWFKYLKEPTKKK